MAGPSPADKAAEIWNQHLRSVAAESAAANLLPRASKLRRLDDSADPQPDPAPELVFPAVSVHPALPAPVRRVRKSQPAVVDLISESDDSSSASDASSIPSSIEYGDIGDEEGWWAADPDQSPNQALQKTANLAYEASESLYKQWLTIDQLQKNPAIYMPSDPELKTAMIKAREALGEIMKCTHRMHSDLREHHGLAKDPKSDK